MTNFNKKGQCLNCHDSGIKNYSEIEIAEIEAMHEQTSANEVKPIECECKSSPNEEKD